jgi:hypothetical protein
LEKGPSLYVVIVRAFKKFLTLNENRMFISIFMRRPVFHGTGKLGSLSVGNLITYYWHEHNQKFFLDEGVRQRASE